MLIKICGIANKMNIPSLCELQPDMLGFIFHSPSPRYVEGKLSPADMSSINPNILRTGVFVNPSDEEVMEKQHKYGLDMIQLHGNESPAFCAGLMEHGVDIIKAFRIDEKFDFKQLIRFIPYCSYFLFDTRSKLYGGSGIKFNWSLLRKYELEHPFILSGGISPGDEEDLQYINHPSLAGIDLNSGFEINPGLKDTDKLKIFIKNIRKMKTA